MAILVTGGTGFIGSHTAISLIEAGYDAVILDNLCNSSINILPRLKKITGKDIPFLSRRYPRSCYAAKDFCRT